MSHLHVLVVTTPETPSVGACIQEQLAFVDVDEVFDFPALKLALIPQVYDVICVQYPLPWIPLIKILHILRVTLPTCPITAFSRRDMWQLERTLARVIPRAEHPCGLPRQVDCSRAETP